MAMLHRDIGHSIKVLRVRSGERWHRPTPGQICGGLTRFYFQGVLGGFMSDDDDDEEEEEGGGGGGQCSSAVGVDGPHPESH